MSAQVIILLFAVAAVVAVVCFFIFTARGRAIQAAAQADVDALHTKVDAIHAKIDTALAHVKALRFGDATAAVQKAASTAGGTPQGPTA